MYEAKLFYVTDVDSVCVKKKKKSENSASVCIVVLFCGS